MDGNSFHDIAPTPDQAFDIIAELLGMKNPTPTTVVGYMDIITEITKLMTTHRLYTEFSKKMISDNIQLKVENKKLKEENKELREVESLLQPFQNTETFHMKVEEMKNENNLLKEQNNQHLEWFEEINTLVGAEKEDPAVISVSEFVEENFITETALAMVKSENETNKKNIMTHGLKVEKMKEKITCLESDSHNEVSQAEYDELKEENQKNIRYLGELADYMGENSAASRVFQEVTGVKPECYDM